MAERGEEWRGTREGKGVGGRGGGGKRGVCNIATQRCR